MRITTVSTASLSLLLTLFTQATAYRVQTIAARAQATSLVTRDQLNSTVFNGTTFNATAPFNSTITPLDGDEECDEEEEEELNQEDKEEEECDDEVEPANNDTVSPVTAPDETLPVDEEELCDEEDDGENSTPSPTLSTPTLAISSGAVNLNAEPPKPSTASFAFYAAPTVGGPEAAPTGSACADVSDLCHLG